MHASCNGGTACQSCRQDGRLMWSEPIVARAVPRPGRRCRRAIRRSSRSSPMRHRRSALMAHAASRRCAAVRRRAQPFAAGTARHRFCANCGHLTDTGQGRLVAALPELRCRTLPARRSRSSSCWPRMTAACSSVASHTIHRAAIRRSPASSRSARRSRRPSPASSTRKPASEVRNVRYIASQPWPFPSSLMIGCHAEADGDALTIDTNELDDARWFTRDGGRRRHSPVT